MSRGVSATARRLSAVKAESEYGLTLEDLFADTLTFSMTVRDKPLEVTWAPARYTPDIEMRALALTGSEDEILEAGEESREDEMRRAEHVRANHQAVREVLAHVLVSWSLRGPDGVEVGTDEITLRSLPSAFLEAVFGALWENAGPKAETEPTSGLSS